MLPTVCHIHIAHNIYPEPLRIREFGTGCGHVIDKGPRARTNQRGNNVSPCRNLSNPRVPIITDVKIRIGIASDITRSVKRSECRGAAITTKSTDRTPGQSPSHCRNNACRPVNLADTTIIVISKVQIQGVAPQTHRIPERCGTDLTTVTEIEGTSHSSDDIDRGHLSDSSIRSVGIVNSASRVAPDNVGSDLCDVSENSIGQAVAVAIRNSYHSRDDSCGCEYFTNPVCKVFSNENIAKGIQPNSIRTIHLRVGGGNPIVAVRPSSDHRAKHSRRRDPTNSIISSICNVNISIGIHKYS